MENCIIADNTGQYGTVYLYSTTNQSPCVSSISDTVIYGNEAEAWAPGLLIQDVRTHSKLICCAVWVVGLLCYCAMLLGVSLNVEVLGTVSVYVHMCTLCASLANNVLCILRMCITVLILGSVHGCVVCAQFFSLFADMFYMVFVFLVYACVVEVNVLSHVCKVQF